MAEPPANAHHDRPTPPGDDPAGRPQTLLSPSPEHTHRWAQRLAATVRPGDVLALEGELGAGKTTLVRGLAQGLGIDPARVSSPTFALVHEYEGPDLSLVHVDAYRLEGPEALDALGWDRLMEDPSVVLVVEWADRLGQALPPSRTTTITLEHAGPQARRITLTPPRGWTRCPTTGKPVHPDCPTWPFADERARMADLYHWLAGDRAISRPIDPEADDLADLAPPPQDDRP